MFHISIDMLYVFTLVARKSVEALQLEEVFKSVALAIHGQSQQLSSEAAVLEEECLQLKRRLRCEVDLTGAERCDLSDEEDNLLDQIGGEDYRRELEELNVQVASSLSDLEEARPFEAASDGSQTCLQRSCCS